MYIEKRWFVPAALTLILLGALLAVVLLLSGARIPPSGRGRSAEIASVASESKAPEPVAGQAPSSGSPPAVMPAAELAPPAEVTPAAQEVPLAPPPVVAEAPVGTTSPEEVVAIGTLASDDTQINTRGFGDIGMQFDDVNNSAPITIVHISSQGNNNTTNVNIGNNDQIVSKQEHLQSNRSDGSQP